MIAISDNLSTRTTQEVTDWLASHPRWQFVFTPHRKHASWLNQVRDLLLDPPAACSSAAPRERAGPAHQMLAFVEVYNQTAKLFHLDVHRQGVDCVRKP